MSVLATKRPEKWDQYEKWVQRDDVRRAVHVGSNEFNASSMLITSHLSNVYWVSEAQLLKDLLREYRFIYYHGQLDGSMSFPVNEMYFRGIVTKSADKYDRAVRKEWWTGRDAAGYTRTVGNFTLAFIRDSGHLAAADHPEWVWDF